MLESDPFFLSHQKSAELISELSSGERSPPFVEGLVTHFIFHFIEEDQLMKRVGYPDQGAHSEAHIGLKEQILRMAPRALSGIISEEDVDLFKDQALHHIKTHDQYLITYLSRHHKHLLDELINENHPTD